MGSSHSQSRATQPQLSSGSRASRIWASSRGYFKLPKALKLILSWSLRKTSFPININPKFWNWCVKFVCSVHIFENKCFTITYMCVYHLKYPFYTNWFFYIIKIFYFVIHLYISDFYKFLIPHTTNIRTYKI